MSSMTQNPEPEKIVHSDPIPVSVERHPTPTLSVPVVASGPNSPTSLSPLLQAARLGSPSGSGSKPRRERSSSFGSLIERIKGNGGTATGKHTESTDTSVKGSKKDDSIIEEEGEDEPCQSPLTTISGLPEPRRQSSAGPKPKVSIFGFSNNQPDPEGKSAKTRSKKSSPGWLQKVLKPSANTIASNTGSRNRLDHDSPPETTILSSSISRPDITKSSWETVITLPAKTAVATWTSNVKSSSSTPSDDPGQSQAVPTNPSWLPLADPVPFDREAVIKRVQKRYNILCNIGLGVNIVTTIGQAAGGDLIGQCFVAIKSMWEMIQKVGLVETSAWRLVERCIDLLIAVDASVKEIESGGHTIGADMRTSVARLTGTLQHGADLVRKLAERNFLKIFLRCDQINDGIQDVTEELEDCIRVFHLQNALNTSAWRMQTEVDRRRDRDILLAKIEEASENDEKMLKILQIRSDEIQESIRTIQRTLDAVFALDRPEIKAAGTPVVARSTQVSSNASSLQLRLSVGSFLGGDLNRDKLHASPLGYYAKDSGPVDIGHRPRGPVMHGKQYRNEAIATPMVRSHVHFLKKGYDVLCRRSASSVDGLPDWTITRLEISRDEQIAFGNYSTVWRGSWQGQIVAIKELNSHTDKELFLREVEVWKPLKHENILELWGASYNEPYFLVSPYMFNKNLLSFLRSEMGGEASKIRLMHGIAEGMKFLHSRDVCHDLKAKNVLISNNYIPMICDFGLSELKMDIERRSRTKPTGGTLRWTAPEILIGHRISFASDVYAFAITICEMLAPNDLPYGYVDSQTVRAMVLLGERCIIPPTAPEVRALVGRCWDHKASERPSFEMITPVLEELLPGGIRKATASTVEVTDSDVTSVSSHDSEHTTTSYQTAGSEEDTPDDQPIFEQYLISPHLTTKSMDSDDGSMTSESSGPSKDGPDGDVDDSIYGSNGIESDRIEKLARSYRHHLSHNFDDRLREPLWQPVSCRIGDIGYMTPTGSFCVLFNAKQGPAINPPVALPIPFLAEPDGRDGILERNISMRNAALRAIDSVTSLTNSVIKFVSRQNGQVEAEREIEWTYSVPLSSLAQPKRAGLVVCEGKYIFLADREPAREYLRANAEAILAAYGTAHRIRKEDIIIVVGGLFTSQWALMMASRDYGSTINFNVHKQRPVGEPWGTWSMVQDQQKRLETNGEAYGPGTRFVTKVSRTSETTQAVLLARLKFPSSGFNRDYPTLH